MALSKSSWGNLGEFIDQLIHYMSQKRVQSLLEVDLLNVNQSNHSLIGAVCVLWVQEHISSDIERHPWSFQPRHWLKPHFYSLNCLISFPSLPSNISLNSFFLPSLRSSSSLFIPLPSCSCFSFLFLSLFLSVIAPFFVPFHFFS